MHKLSAINFMNLISIHMYLFEHLGRLEEMCIEVVARALFWSSFYNHKIRLCALPSRIDDVRVALCGPWWICDIYRYDVPPRHIAFYHYFALCCSRYNEPRIFISTTQQRPLSSSSFMRPARSIQWNMFTYFVRSLFADASTLHFIQL